MNYDKWEQIKALVSDKFDLTDKGEEQIDDLSSKEYLEFVKDDQRMKLELIIKPKVVEKKTIYSRRIGSETSEKFIYDETEKVYSLKVYRYDDVSDAWEEIEPSFLA